MLGALPQAQVVFNYLGQVDNSRTESSPSWGFAGESAGLVRSPRNKQRYLIEVNAIISGERLHLTWKYCENLHRRATIERLANGYIHALQSILTSHQSSSTSRHRVSPDFPGSDLGQEKLDKVLAELKLR